MTKKVIIVSRKGKKLTLEDSLALAREIRRSIKVPKGFDSVKYLRKNR